jgi:hypothetical protein
VIQANETRWFHLSVDIPDDYDSGQWSYQVNLLEELPVDGGWSIGSSDGSFDVS